MLYGTVCIVLIITILISFWWLLQKPYTKEDFIVPAPYLVMAAIDLSGAVYYADVDVPISPKWIKMNPAQIGDIAGSYGKLYTVGTSGGVVRYGSYDSSSQTEFTSKQSVKEISVDDDGRILGSDTSIYTFPSPGGSMTPLTANTATVSTVSISGGTSFAVGTDNNLYYYSSLTSVSTLTERNPPGTNGKITQVSYDGAVCALQGPDGTLWCADTNVGANTANWKKQGTRKFSQISLKGGRLVGVAKDGYVYYSNTYENPTWTRVPIQEYNVTTGLPISNGTSRFRKVIMFYPGLDARRKRYAVAGKPCGTDEQQIGNFCYAPCASGRAAAGTRCPYRRKHTPAIPSCESGEYINGSCYQPCPDNTTTAAGQLCVGNVVVKDIKGRNTNVSPPKYSCGDGAIRARYIRIRPTDIGTVNNNKLCISKIVVKDKDDNVLSLPSAAPSIQSTIGSIAGTSIGYSSIPVSAIKTVNIPGAASSTTSLKVYVATHGARVVMIADDSVGTAKYYSGTLGGWTDSYWTDGTGAGNRTTKQYVLTLNTKPVEATATDGTCADKPIGGTSCPGAWTTYVSSNKYDSESDGGRVSRTIKTYWDLDLGAVLPIRTIEFTGCNYVPATGATSSSIDETALSQPNADQITGMRIQLLESSNLPTIEPIAERTLGPEIKQVLTFNYSTIEPGVDTTCYDRCPKINGVQSVDGGQQTCISASSGVTSRSVTRPLKLADPVCGLPVNADGTPYVLSLPGDSGSSIKEIRNWVINPTTSTQVLSCDTVPGSILMPLQNKYNIPVPIASTNTPTTITYTLQRPDNRVYTPSDPLAPYKCVLSNDEHCNKYNVGAAIYKYRNGLCIRMDINPPNNTNDDFKQVPLHEKCPSGYKTWWHDVGFCHNTNAYPVWGKREEGEGNITMRLYDGARTLFDIDKGNPLVSNPPKTRAYTVGVTTTSNVHAESVDDIKIPLFNEKYVSDPKIFPAQCKCLNANGTVNKDAYVYNNTCVKCASPNQLFYARGAMSNKFQWSEEYKNKYLSIYNDRVTKAIDQKPFTSLNDAKTMCETDSSCTGITRSYDKEGKSYYYLRAGTVLKGRVPLSGGSAGSEKVIGVGDSEKVISSASLGGSGSSRGSDGSGDNFPTRDSSWIKGASGSSTVLVGLRKGSVYSSLDIPSAFADDYISPVARGASIFSIIPTTVTDLINSMANNILQTASAWASFQNSVQNPNTYYQLVGVERQLSAASKPSDNGICVAPCDPKHTLHDPIQMIIDSATSPSLYVLYGTTCHDATQKIISKPSLPGIYTPQVGADCSIGYDLNTAGSCVQECSSNSIDNGSSCANNSIRRPSKAPNYTCPLNLIQNGDICLHPCEDGYAEDGDYCEPVATKVDLPSTINCVQTPYTYSTKYYGSGTRPTSVTKWLCDSEDDQTMLLEGPTGSSIISGTNAYVNKNDIVCYADDSSTGMYYCQTVFDAINNPDYTKIDNHSTTCDSMTKAYFDLSNNLTSLLSAQTTANSASVQMMGIKMTLESTIGKMCGTGSGSGSGSSSGTCNTLRTLLNSLHSNINSGSGAISGVLSPINVAIASRDNLIGLLRNAKCCSNIDDGYPWC
jgi:hypothetical protein